MYVCKDCGNRKSFIEHICTEKEVTLDEVTGERCSSTDTFSGCFEVICAVCGASSDYEAILDSENLKPLGF